MKVSKEDNNYIYYWVSKNIKKQRKNKGWTQKQLAEKMGIKQQQLSRWEKDKIEPAVSSIVAIAKALDVDFNDLFDGLL